MTEILEIKQDTLAAIAEAEQLLFTDPWTENALEGHLASEGGRGYFILEQNRMAGYLLGTLAFGEGEVFRIGIRPEYRRRGLGKALLSHFLEEGKKAGSEQIFLEVRESNAPARALYESLDFHIIGERKRYYRNPVEGAVLYRKVLL